MEFDLKQDEDIQKFQEIVAEGLQKGKIVEKEYITLYNQLKDKKIKSNNIISKNIEFLKNHYEKLSLEEKFVVNNLIFALEIINGNAKEGFRDYVKRGLRFYTHKMSNNKEAEFFVEFVRNFEDERFLIDIMKEIFNEYFNYPYMERRAIIANTLVVIWNNKKLFNNTIWLEVFEVLVKTIEEAIKKELIEDEMPLHFLAYHIYGNNIHTIDEWRVFNEKVEKKSSKFYKEWGERNNLPKCKSEVSKGKKKIGFLIDRIVFNSPFMVFYSLLKSLTENDEFKKNYEIYVYSMEYVYKQQDDENLIEALSSLGVKVYSPKKFLKEGYYFSHLAKALDIRNLILKDGIDYLIGGGGYDIPIFLFANRSAPVQVFWSHGNCVSDLIGIDKRISHFEQECKEWEWDIFNVPIAEEFLIGSEEDKKQGKAVKESLLLEYGKDTVILGTIGRLIKINSDEYLKVISEIMKQNPNTIYLACGDGNKEEIEEKLKKHGIDRDRFIFTGMVNPHVFGWVIDVWINTFPLPQGHSQEEFHAKGNGVVINGNPFKCKNFDNDYDAIMANYKNRMELFLKMYEIENIHKNINWYDLRLNLYKKYRNIDKNIYECIKKLKQIKSCKERWFEYLNCLIRNKSYFEMEKFMIYRQWQIEKKYLNSIKGFLNILK